MNEKRVMLITGTSRGIGKEIARYYSDGNYQVIGVSRSESDLSKSCYEHFSRDITNEKEMLKLFRNIKTDYDRLDVLINNAGIASMNHSLLTPMETVEKTYRTNVFGTFLCCREGAKLMKQNEFGRIVNITSIATPLDLEGESIYASSKSSVQSLTRILAKEYADFGITVNAIGPSPIKTDLIDPVDDEKIEELMESLTISDYASQEDVINVIDFYIQPESDFITGQCLWLGGVS